MPEVSTWIAYRSKLTFYKSNDGDVIYTWSLMDKDKGRQTRRLEIYQTQTLSNHCPLSKF